MTNYNYNTCLYLSLVIDQDDFNPYMIFFIYFKCVRCIGILAIRLFSYLIAE